MTIICNAKSPKKRFRLEPIYGNCLEKIGVKNEGGGYAVIDKNAIPRVGDLVHCAKISGQIGGYIKQVKEIRDGTYIVGTAYLDETKNFQFEAAEIYGTVIETYGKIWNNREYTRTTANVVEVAWISVEERLPSDDEQRDEYGELVPFLVCERDTKYPYRAFYDGMTWGDGLMKIKGITHWMPLPEVPEQRKEDEGK